ncbi:MAG TPA: hypothetical protein VK586_04390 [Streptosporangiaceae bacterium]|jgi:hypothetical protein|nr:hypothetical protein [Streptosporangiaceae bacterium]
MTSVGSVLKPENSMIAGLAVVGLVIANYNLHNGSVSSNALSPAENGAGNLTTTNKKAGWTSIVMVAGVSLLAKDANIFILGMAAVIAMHSSYLHSIAVSPQLNKIVSGPEAAGAYLPAAA